ncbi:MAG: penicillin acylase family protein, partial [Actinobacteria bacterium]|nr:penicillin acylase family protein [Actinomycetota bacterium]
EPAAPILRGLARLAEGFPSGMSNWLAVTADRSASGHPVAVMGPQTGYFVPEILMEVAVHAPGFDARGATFPGVSLYVLLGRGPDFAWSATSGGSDLIDVRAELLCDPEGGTPAPDATHYVFDGGCVPMTVRTDTWLAKPNAAALEPPTVVEARVERTVHGPVFARGTVDGAPVAFVRQRSTFFGELDSALAFVELSSGAVHDAASFQRAISRVTGSFNWLYVDDRDVAYYHSGLYPVRAPGVDPDLPSWGTGDWEWRGFVPFEDHPLEVNPARGFIASWNNKPARDWRAADSTWTFGSVHRSEILADRLAARVPAGAVTPSDMVEIMADAATVDLRGQEVLPPVLRAIGRGPKDLGPALGLLQAWVADGAHRLDRDGDGEYEHQAAVALMEEWWEPLIRHVLDPSLDGLYEHVPSRFDDGNREAGLGSAFQGGYYGYVEKAVRMASGGRVDGRYEVLRCADGTRRGCRAALVESLREAIAALGPDPSTWDFDESSETIRFTAIGLLTIDPIPWQNRPTFQQVVEVTADAQAAGGSP